MNKYKSILGGAAMAAVLLVTGADASAVEQVNVSRVSGYFNGGGGEFLVHDLSNVGLLTPYLAGVNATGAAAYGGSAPAPLTLGFATFCLEHNEGISVGNGGTTYNYQYGSGYGSPDSDISAFARNGGNGAAPDGFAGADPVSVGTALLYNLFSRGALASYNYTPGAGRIASAEALQDAIWYLENEVALPSSFTGSVFESILLGRFGSIAAAKGATAFDIKRNEATDASSYGVFALNLGPNLVNSGIVQDILIWDGTGGQTVPDGGTTLLLLGLGMTGMVALQRRIGKNA